MSRLQSQKKKIKEKEFGSQFRLMLLVFMDSRKNESNNFKLLDTQLSVLKGIIRSDIRGISNYWR